MNIKFKEYNCEEDGKVVEEGVFLYDGDIITESEAHLIIKEWGAEMNNRIFSNEAPCLFLPKNKAELLFSKWFPYLIKTYKE